MLPEAVIVLTEPYISVIMSKCVASVVHCLKVSVVLCSFIYLLICLFVYLFTYLLKIFRGAVSSLHASVWNV